MNSIQGDERKFRALTEVTLAFVLIRKLSKMYKDIVRSRFFVRIAERSFHLLGGYTCGFHQRVEDLWYLFLKSISKLD